jgi:hypothetical protein
VTRLPDSAAIHEQLDQAPRAGPLVLNFYLRDISDNHNPIDRCWHQGYQG